MSASTSDMPGGQPSITQPMAGPCDSPNVVTVKSVPRVLPDMDVAFGNQCGETDIMPVDRSWRFSAYSRLSAVDRSWRFSAYSGPMLGLTGVSALALTPVPCWD